MTKKLINDNRILLEQYAEKYELKTLSNKLFIIHDEMNRFSLKILFVGKFSAGKSALINAFLSREVLGEGLRPETAIAGELIYDSDEYVEAVENDNKVRFELNAVNNIDVTKYDFLIWHLNCDILRKLKGNTIVDMPGFNSGIQDHNKAILQYIGKGNAYILVIDSEEGAIKQSMTQFIDEIKNYDDNMSIIVSKSDLKLPEDMDKIEKSIKNNADMLFSGDIDVISTSKYDENIVSKVSQVIESFDEENIYIQTFLPQLYDIAIRMKDSLEVYKASIKWDMSSFDKEIKKHEKSKKELSEKLNRENKKLENKFKNSVVPSIIADTQNALYNQVDELVNSLNVGGQAFSMTVNNILRPILLSSTQRYMEQSFDEYLTDICIDTRNVDGAVEEISQNALEKYKQFNDKLQEISRNSDKYSAIYKTITTTLSVATTVIAPWLELLIIFLPDIIKLFTKNNQSSDVRNKVNDQIIPQIVTKLRPEIENSLLDMKNETIDLMTKELMGLIDVEIEAIEKAKELKRKKLNEYNAQINEVDNDINTVNIILKSLAI